MLKELSSGGMFSGVVNAFNIVIKSKKEASAFDSKVFLLFQGVNLSSDAQKFESNKEGYISTLNLTKQKAYDTFLQNYVFNNISEQKKIETKEYAKKDKKGYGFKSVNVIYGMIKYLSSIKNFNFDMLMKKLFQDLYIIKMGLSKEGIPKFEIQTTVDAKDIFKINAYHVGKNYSFRSKASWDRVRDKLGIQL